MAATPPVAATATMPPAMPKPDPDEEALCNKHSTNYMRVAILQHQVVFKLKWSATFM
jgi:hypothetical protein